tara:strand:+ start:1084 stop:1518 length:435 start_codon:yes stop_codon:yes gene_type:complete
MITTLIIEKTLSQHLPSKNIIIINKEDTTNTIRQIKKINDMPIHIYDVTHTQKHENNEIITVSNHINKTGHNPLIGYQKMLPEPFIDLSQLYYSTNGVITHSLGKHFKTHKEKYKYPSKYLCYISIIARALGKNNIHAFLVNQL